MGRVVFLLVSTEGAVGVHLVSGHPGTAVERLWQAELNNRGGEGAAGRQDPAGRNLMATFDFVSRAGNSGSGPFQVHRSRGDKCTALSLSSQSL